MTIKRNSVAVAAVLATLATAGITVPAFAQTKTTPSWDTCYSLSVERGAAPGRGGGTNADSQHNASMDQCLAGKIPLTAEGSPRARSLGGAFASASVPKHTKPAPRGDQVANGTRHATLNASIEMTVETQSHGYTADRCLAIFTSEVAVGMLIGR